MAERRMITMSIVGADSFLEMPVEAQNLYFHLNLRADDDGFVNSPRTVAGDVGADETDLQRLLDKGLILGFENGVVVITHWRMHNKLRKDRYVPTQYQDLLDRLTLMPNGTYVELAGPRQDPYDSRIAAG